MSTNREIQKFVQDTLHSLLDSINKGFQDNELAYLSSQGKNELQIRDKIAWLLHNKVTKKYGNQYVVCREWSPKGFGRAKVDLAILELDATRTYVISVIALIEFKAQSVVKKEKWYLTEFEHDLKKMKDIITNPQYTICKDADMYFVFLETGQEEKVEQFRPIIAYSQYLTQNVKYYKDTKDYISALGAYWKDFNSRLINPQAIQEPKVIDIGEAYGYRQYLSPLIIGPLKTTDIKSQQ
ncbi:MAG: hypothetical protein J6T32_01465 [Paludibacteraceae bacterium]|nr:hypothetical protein [Paludibacteraceae bacterium]